MLLIPYEEVCVSDWPWLLSQSTLVHVYLIYHTTEQQQLPYCVKLVLLGCFCRMSKMQMSDTWVPYKGSLHSEGASGRGTHALTTLQKINKLI